MDRGCSAAVMPCFVRLKDVGGERTVMLPKNKLTREQKQLLLPTKKSKKAQTGTKRAKKQDGKFQMKISGFFSPPSKKKQMKGEANNDEEDIKKEDLKEEVGKEKEDRASPDSGVGSRSGTPSDSTETSRANTPENEENDAEQEVQDVDEGLEADVEKEKAKFLDDLDGSDEELSSSSSEEEDSEDEWKGENSKTDWNEKIRGASRKPAAKGKKGKGNILAPIVIPGAMKSELAMSDYEKIRDGNIKARDEMLAKLMADFNQYKQENGLVKQQPKKVHRRKTTDGQFQSTARAPLTRRKSSRLTEEQKKETFGSIEWMTPEGERRKKLAEENSDYEEDDEEPERKRISHPKRWAVDPNVDVLMPEDVTPKMLANISYSSTGKTYDTARGTTCHQCRQKTIDQKTVCRSGDCSGVRGMFCGRCLQNRYGEEAEAALMNPTWCCPPCRGFCNCSICRNRNGKGATGILIHLAQEKGFNNVKDYLISLQTSKGNDEYDE